MEKYSRDKLENHFKNFSKSSMLLLMLYVGLILKASTKKCSNILLHLWKMWCFYRTTFKWNWFKVQKKTTHCVFHRQWNKWRRKVKPVLKCLNLHSWGPPVARNSLKSSNITKAATSRAEEWSYHVASLGSQSDQIMRGIAIYLEVPTLVQIRSLLAPKTPRWWRP